MSGRGMLLTSPSNYIPNFYKLENKDIKPSSFDEFVFKNKETIANMEKKLLKLVLSLLLD